MPNVRAEEPVKNYTDVLLDLSVDENFKFTDYPAKSDDYGITVIQIAESADSELLLYTYQAGNATHAYNAISVNMSLTETPINTKLYNLTLVSSNGVFCKYVVNGLTVSSESERFYNLTSIYRQYIKGVDDESDNDNKIETIVFDVGKVYRVTTDNGKPVYECKDTEIIEILNPFAGHLEYSEGFKFFPEWCDSHFVAFSTDRHIDKLMEARVSFSNVTVYTSNSAFPRVEDEETRVVNNSRIVNADEMASNKANGWFANEYSWDRIQRTVEFMAENNLTDSAIKGLNETEWVLCFVESSRSRFFGDPPLIVNHKYMRPQPNPVTGTINWTVYTEVYDVKVLYLTFETRGVVYSLGAVSNGVTGNSAASNKNKNETGFLAWLKNHAPLIICIIVGVILFIILMPFMPGILNALGKGIVAIGKGLWWLICAPFRGIKALIDKRKGGA